MISAIRCRCGSGRDVGPGVQAFWAVPMLQLCSTTAAISAIRCRCGSGRDVGPGVQAFWAVLMLQLRSTTAAISAIRCRCGRYYGMSIPAVCQFAISSAVLKCRHAGVLQVFDNEVNVILLCAFMPVSKLTKAHNIMVII